MSFIRHCFENVEQEMADSYYLFALISNLTWFQFFNSIKGPNFVAV